MIRHLVVAMMCVNSLGGCSLGTQWRGEKTVEQSQEIPLAWVPWISQEQQQEEKKRIFPCYLALKRRQECAQRALNLQFYKLDSTLCK
ncbi:hypothetical protein [Holospora curviuscula]|uniref:hypothetical protein n=1 Tax=Holospora curviuscula TaxID=1082868 RepID=UPI0013FD4B3B|nr:hypothetical protein [Holospora curviuscula]